MNAVDPKTIIDEELEAMLAAVDELAEAMKRKLREKAREGFHGGLEPSNRFMVTKMLAEHVEQMTTFCPHCEREDEDGGDARQAIDVCNLAMMLWVIAGKPTL